MAAVCCPPGSIGAAPLSTEKTLGHMETIAAEHPLECYVTGAPLKQAKRVVLLFTDVFGIDTGHHKVVADRLASQLSSDDDTLQSHTTNTTTTVVVPDFFRGNPILKEYFSWLRPKFMADVFISLPQILYNVKFRITDRVLDRDLLQIVLPWLHLETENRIREIGISCVGFCFGGWLTAHTLALSNKLVDNNNSCNNCNMEDSDSSVLLLPVKCGVGIHPSFKIELVRGRKEEDLARAVGTKPILLLPAENDDLKPETHQAVKILAEARGVAETEIAVAFPTMIHGWVTRGDSNNPAVKEQQEMALKLTVDFIQTHHPVQ